MHPLLIVLIAWLVLSLPASLVVGAIVGGADVWRRRFLGSDRAEREVRVEVLAGNRDSLITGAVDVDARGHEPSLVTRVAATTAA